MVRPLKRRFLREAPSVVYFKPQGIPLRELEEVVLYHDELEALRLYECDGLSQIDAAQSMRISQATFSRILERANKKVAAALVYGKAICIKGDGAREDGLDEKQ